MSTYHDKDEI